MARARALGGGERRQIARQEPGLPRRGVDGGEFVGNEIPPRRGVARPDPDPGGETRSRRRAIRSKVPPQQLGARPVRMSGRLPPTSDRRRELEASAVLLARRDTDDATKAEYPHQEVHNGFPDRLAWSVRALRVPLRALRGVEATSDARSDLRAQVVNVERSPREHVGDLGFDEIGRFGNGEAERVERGYHAGKKAPGRGLGRRKHPRREAGRVAGREDVGGAAHAPRLQQGPVVGDRRRERVAGERARAGVEREDRATRWAVLHAAACGGVEQPVGPERRGEPVPGEPEPDELAGGCPRPHAVSLAYSRLHRPPAVDSADPRAHGAR